MNGQILFNIFGFIILGRINHGVSQNIGGDPMCTEVQIEQLKTLCAEQCASTQQCTSGLVCCPNKCGGSCVPNQFEDPKAGPQFETYSPSYGPVDGGTIITLTGDISQLTVKAVTLKNVPYDSGTGARGINTDFALSCQIIGRDIEDNNLYVRTPLADKKLVGLKLMIHVTVGSSQISLSGEYNTYFSFVYKQNPVITEISPNKVFLRGGLEITAIGQFLDSVANPVMYIDMEKRLYNTVDKNYQITDTVAFKSQNTKVYNSTVIIGITPEINISKSSTESNFNKNLNQGIPQRRKRQNDNNIPVNSESIQFFVGFELDGVQTFRNLSEAISPEEGRLVVYHNPAIHQFEKLQKYDPELKSPIELKGERLDLGATMKDYIVTIGDGSCEVIELTENQMFCQPPEKEPSVVKSVRSMEGKPTVSVAIGYFNFHVGHIDYVGDDTTLYIIIGVVVAVVLLVAVVILTAVLCCRKNN